MADEIKQYPEWQKTIRKAQAASREKAEAKEKAEQEARFIENMKKEEALEAGFKKAMAYLGLPVPTEGTRMKLDGFQFDIVTYHEWASVPGTPGRPGNPAVRLPTEGKPAPDMGRFEITITKPMPDDISKDVFQDYHENAWMYVQVFDWPQKFIEYDFTLGGTLDQKGMTRVADKLDELEMEYQEVVAIVREWKTKSAAAKVSEPNKPDDFEPSPKPPTTQEQLLTLIRRVIREEMQTLNEY